MNLPNKLTVMRMILVPFVVAALLYPFPHHYLAALLLFAAASYTDHLDGKIARRDNLVTDFGKFMDPLADKVMVLSGLFHGGLGVGLSASKLGCDSGRGVIFPLYKEQKRCILYRKG